MPKMILQYDQDDLIAMIADCIRLSNTNNGVVKADSKILVRLEAEPNRDYHDSVVPGSYKFSCEVEIG